MPHLTIGFTNHDKQINLYKKTPFSCKYFSPNHNNSRFALNEIDFPVSNCFNSVS